MLEGPNVILRLFTDEDLDEFLKLEGAFTDDGRIRFHRTALASGVSQAL